MNEQLEQLEEQLVKILKQRTALVKSGHYCPTIALARIIAELPAVCEPMVWTKRRHFDECKIGIYRYEILPHRHDGTFEARVNNRVICNTPTKAEAVAACESHRSELVELFRKGGGE